MNERKTPNGLLESSGAGQQAGWAQAGGPPRARRLGRLTEKQGKAGSKKNHDRPEGRIYLLFVSAAAEGGGSGSPMGADCVSFSGLKRPRNGTKRWSETAPGQFMGNIARRNTCTDAACVQAVMIVIINSARVSIFRLHIELRYGLPILVHVSL